MNLLLRVEDKGKEKSKLANIWAMLGDNNALSMYVYIVKQIVCYESSTYSPNSKRLKEYKHYKWKEFIHTRSSYDVEKQ